MSMTPIKRDDFDKVITPENFDAFTSLLERFEASLSLIGKLEGRQVCCDDVVNTLQPIHDGIDLIWTRAYDRGHAIHAHAVSTTKDHQQPSPNEDPSKQVDLVAQNLAASLRILLTMLATGPLNATTDTPTAIEMARAITLHALDGMNYVLQADDGKASESFNNSSRLSALFNNGLKS